MNIVFDLEHLLHYHSIYLWLFNRKKILAKIVNLLSVCFFFFFYSLHHAIQAFITTQHLTPFKIHSDLRVLKSYGQFLNFILFNFSSIFSRIDGSFFLQALSACGIQ